MNTRTIAIIALVIAVDRPDRPAHLEDRRMRTGPAIRRAPVDPGASLGRIKRGQGGPATLWQEEAPA